ncbi:VOC family protein [Xylanimonas protaetiae]|uniref:VOC family protein n=1 Tax=Xylanimonas protaetiae TaxID=2509457 RepID=A0A4P6F8L0_9MICO|nr:VOC family protein [Xylanimonas protaetiae]QAY70659.1 VOC family protein [Xylanimonas protaetiae]
MVAFVSHVTVDCRNAYELAQWWKPVLGYQDDPDDPNQPGQAECVIVDPAGQGVSVLFIEVPEPRTVKNRVHLDLRPAQDARDVELERLLAHGATVVQDHRGISGPGTGWVWLADPEGNDFCILRSPAELAATAPPSGS